MDCSKFKLPVENARPVVTASEDRESFFLRFGTADDQLISMSHQEARELLAKLETGETTVCGHDFGKSQISGIVDSLKIYFFPQYTN